MADDPSRVPLPGESPVHGWFGLTYAAYLVLPRLVMESMPLGWQERMVSLLEECDERLGHHFGENEYVVQLRRGGKFVSDPLRDYRRGPPLSAERPGVTAT